jgi:hypothetical protein
LERHRLNVGSHQKLVVTSLEKEDKMVVLLFSLDRRSQRQRGKKRVRTRENKFERNREAAMIGSKCESTSVATIKVAYSSKWLKTSH